MLLPDVALPKERVILLVNSVILALAWMCYLLLPKARPSFSVLGAFTLAYAALLLIQIMAKHLEKSSQSYHVPVIVGTW
ncbi:hypothetical protein [Levilactobacillus brevis]|uniref:hypothetical protein n=1 Tax=Levilactobacillus brevis TaxID=1580 RepID=UPI002073A075|nr:hypothetical protein [Levilactobacillus brevis]MCM6796283.1 hypothetical protein [Levilactobacillus brevis]